VIHKQSAYIVGLNTKEGKHNIYMDVVHRYFIRENSDVSVTESITGCWAVTKKSTNARLHLLYPVNKLADF
jgi:hypothetical protein